VSVKLSTRQVGDVNVVDVAGRITLGEGSSALRDLLRDMVGKNQKKILLNLITKLYTVFDVHDDEAAAVRSFA
jgi:anti-sigma B factor antagonist